jgi:hypothetical protein
MNPSQGGPGIGHLLGDVDEALLCASGMKSDAIPIVVELLARQQLNDAVLAVRALEVFRKHDLWPGTGTIAQLLNLTSEPCEAQSQTDPHGAVAAALVKSAEGGIGEDQFRSWCRKLAPSFYSLKDVLPAAFVPLLAVETLLRSKQLELHAARSLASSGRDDLVLEVAKEVEQGPMKKENTGALVAMALDARTTPSPELGLACGCLGIHRVMSGALHIHQQLRMLDNLKLNDGQQWHSALTARVAIVAPEALLAWVAGIDQMEVAQGFMPHLRKVPGAVLSWLVTVLPCRWFSDLAAIAVGPELPSEEADPSDRSGAFDSHWNLLDAVSSLDGVSLTIDRAAPELTAAIEAFGESDAGRVLRALEKNGNRQVALPIALAIIDQLLTPSDLGRLFAVTVHSWRAMHPEVLARVPAEAFVPVIRAIPEDRWCAREWIESLPRPEVAWRALAQAGRTPGLRGLARARLAARDLLCDTPLERADLACVFGHRGGDEPLTSALVTEARRLLTDAFVQNPEYVESWGSLAWVVENSKDADLLDRLRRCWLVLLKEGRSGSEALSFVFLPELDAHTDRELAIASLCALGERYRDVAPAAQFIARLPEALVTLAARSPKTPMMLRLAALSVVVAQPDFDADKLDLSGNPELLVWMLDHWRSQLNPLVAVVALDRTFRLLVDQPLDTTSQDDTSTHLRALRESVRRLKSDPELFREVIRKRLRYQLLKVRYSKGMLVPAIEVVEAWLRATAWVRDWPDGRLARDIEELVSRLNPREAATLSSVLAVVRPELAKPPLQPEAERELVLKALTLRKLGATS